MVVVMFVADFFVSCLLYDVLLARIHTFISNYLLKSEKIIVAVVLNAFEC